MKKILALGLGLSLIMSLALLMLQMLHKRVIRIFSLIIDILDPFTSRNEPVKYQF